MRNQYAGDLSDLLKFSLLRALSMNERTIGIAWYYNPSNDRRQDGRHREYCDEEKWAALDGNAWDALRRLGERSIDALERLQIWPAKIAFHRDAVPRPHERIVWAQQMTATLEDADILLVDPDNGLGKSTKQHATPAEIAGLRRSGRTVVLIKFPGQSEKHDKQLERYHHSLLSEVGAFTAITVRTCVSVRIMNKNGRPQAVPRTRWFTLIDADPLLIERAEEFTAKLKGIEKCTAEIVYSGRLMPGSAEKSQTALLQLMGALERALRSITSDQSAQFYKQIQIHSTKFSDVAGINDARRVRNSMAHGEIVPSTRLVEACEILRQALTEISPHCPERIRGAIREVLDVHGLNIHSAPTNRPVALRSSQTIATCQTAMNNQSRIANVCPECGHQFKGHGFDGIDAHWRARHESVMPYRQAWPLIKSGTYRSTR